LRRQQGVPVGDIGLDGQGAVAELGGQHGDPVEAPREQRHAVAVGGQRAGGRGADPGRGAGDDGGRSLVDGSHGSSSSG
jgi:hypothetical protein